MDGAAALDGSAAAAVDGGGSAEGIERGNNVRKPFLGGTIKVGLQVQVVKRACSTEESMRKWAGIYTVFHSPETYISGPTKRKQPRIR